MKSKEKTIATKLTGKLTTEAGVPLDNARLTAWLVSLDDPVGTKVGHHSMVGKSADWSISFDLGKYSRDAASRKTFRPHLRFEIVRQRRGDRQSRHELLRFNIDLAQPVALTVPNAFYPEIERVEHALARLAKPASGREDDIRTKIVAAEEQLATQAFDAFEQAQGEAALSGLPINIVYGLVRAGAQKDKPGSTDDQVLLRFAVERGYVGDEVVDSKNLKLVRAWRQRLAEAEKETETQRRAEAKAEQDQKQREVELADNNRQEQERLLKAQRLRDNAERLLRHKEHGSTSLGAILNQVALPEQTQLAYAHILVDKPGASYEEVEKQLKSAGINKKHRDTIRRVRNITAQIGDYPPLFAHVWKTHRKANGRGTTHGADLKTFARRTAADWQQILETEKIKPPENIQGTSLDARRRAYAQEIENRFEHLYPHDALLDRLSREPKLGPAYRLLKRQPGLDLRIHPIPPTLRKGKSKDADENVGTIERLQRLVRLGTATESVGLLTKTNLSSASEIASLSRKAFVSMAEKAGIDKERAENIHDLANVRSASALAVITNFTPSLHAMDPGAVRIPLNGSGTTEGSGSAQPTDTSANLETLFGPESACSVEDCQSVLGRPAYYFDLLEEVRTNNVVPSSEELLTELFKRRPDLGEIELSCENTDTRLPYVDLVNEILERVIANKSHTRPFPQTTWSADDLATCPEHLETDAYEKKLRVADYPWSLPFSLAHEEARAYLSQLGISLFQLMELLNPPGVGDVVDDSGARLAGEYLGMAEREVEYFLGHPLESEAPYWGLDVHSVFWSGNEIRTVRKFLGRAGVSWLELLELLLSDFINPGHGVQPFVEVDDKPADGAPVQIRLGAKPCDLDVAQLVGMQRGFLVRFRLFVRLWRRLGWTIRELDHAISVFRVGLSRPFIIHAANIQRLHDELQISIEDILSFYGDVDTEARWDWPSSPQPRIPSQFERVFLDKSALSEKQCDLMSLPLTEGADPKPLHSAEAAIRAVLGLSEADWVLLTDSAVFSRIIGVPLTAGAVTEEWTHVFVADPKLTVGALSRLYRAVTLARALRLTLPELLTFQAITGIDPFVAPSGTLDFRTALDRQRAVGFTVAELDYLLRDHGQLSDVIGTNRGAALERLKEALRKAQPGGDGLAHITQTIVSTHFRVPLPVVTVMLKKLGEQDDGVLMVIAVGRPVDEVRVTTVYTWLEKSVYAIQKLRLAGDEVDLPVVSGDEQFRPCAAFDWKLLPVVPLTASVRQSQLRFAEWRKFIDLVDAKERLAVRKVSLWELREAAREEAATVSTTHVYSASWQVAGTRLGVPPVELQALIGIAAHELCGSEWRRIVDVLEMVDKLGVSVTSARAWVSYGSSGAASKTNRQDWLTLLEASKIRNAVRSRHDANAWEKVARGLRGRLREKQRDALVAYLCARDPGASTAADLYGKYLVDVQMGAQQDTTRIELAVASVQLFIQRVLLGLEKKDDGTTLSFNADFAERWEWMKRYESWRNCRQVFLYPENYLRPDLRSSKSPLFIEAEQALAQIELKKENLEDIVAEYVRKLDEVARLEVVGTCMEELPLAKGGVARSSLLYIIGRTNGHPHIYYQRTYNPETDHFTPWIKIDLDIDGEWVFPIVRDGRLTLYWVKHEKGTESLKDTVGMTSVQPFPLQPHFPMFQDQYRLSWSTFYRGKWTPKKIAEQLITRPFLPFSQANFAVRIVGERVRISGLTVVRPSVPPEG